MRENNSSNNNGDLGVDSFVAWKKNAIYWEDEQGLPSVPHPETPKEPLEFLSRSWSISASEISKKLNARPQKVDPYQSGRHSVNPRKSGPIGIGRWFNNKEYNPSSLKKKEKARIDNAHMHSSLCVAGLAAALHAVAAEENKKATASKMSQAVASATELLAHHCLEMAEASGADLARVSSTFRSASDVRGASDLVTLTAAAATALRGEAALKARASKDSSRRTASVLPCDKSMVESQAFPNCHYEGAEVPCVGDLLQRTKKSSLEWKHVTAYVNQKSRVKIKLKSKSVAAGAFCKKKKCVVYEVCEDISSWPAKKARENVEVYFGVRTSHGVLEFKCKNKIHKQKWVRGIQDLFRLSASKQEDENSKRIININGCIFDLI